MNKLLKAERRTRKNAASVQTQQLSSTFINCRLRKKLNVELMLLTTEASRRQVLPYVSHVQLYVRTKTYVYVCAYRVVRENVKTFFQYVPSGLPQMTDIFTQLLKKITIFVDVQTRTPFYSASSILCRLNRLLIAKLLIILT